MAIINVETPQGIVKVEIAGDQPTQQEADAIRSQFFETQRRDLTFDDLLERQRQLNKNKLLPHKQTLIQKLASKMQV